MASKVTPLWYQVYHRHFSFKEFLDRFNDKEFQERDVLPIFVLSVLYGHDPYVNGMHILHALMGDKGITERALKYFYLYWSIGKGFSDDFLLAGNPIGGTFRKINIRLPSSFTSEFIYDWMAIVLRAFFNIPCFIPNETYYQRGNMKALAISLKYAEKAQEDRFEIQDKTTEKIYKLALAHSYLTELMQFFQSGIFPQILRPYRRDRTFFRSLVRCFWPPLLKAVQNDVSLSEEEMVIIEAEHRNLYEAGDIDFFIHYIETFAKTFGKDHPLVIQLHKYLEPSNENDRLRAEQYLKLQNPIQRRKYIPQYLPVTDLQLTYFINQIKEHGIIHAVKPYILNNKRIIEQQLELSGCELANDSIISTQCSIFIYSIDQLVLHTEGNKLYVFLPEELSKFAEKENPFNRQSLPDYLFAISFQDLKSESLEEVWSKILRHGVDFQSVLDE